LSRVAAPFVFFLAAAVTGPGAAADASGPVHDLVVRQGDTLIGIGERYLARPSDWPQLQKLNRVPDPRRLQPGSTVRIPLALMKEEAAQAEVVTAVGNSSTADGTRLAAGNRLAAGTVVRTGDDGFLTLRAPDGSTIALQPRSEARIGGIARYVNTDIFSTIVRLVTGRVEALVTRLNGPSRFNVQTDSAVAGVRGTRFRVAADPAKKRAQTEVLEGAVNFAGAAAGSGAVEVGAGFGSVTDDTGRALPPAALLQEPRLAASDALQERLVTRFRFPQVDGAARYRAQIAADGEFRRGIGEAEFSTPEIKFADLPDGDYFLRARAVDAVGLEGRDAVFAFKLKARPEPPLASNPAPNGRVRATAATFAWAASTEASSYRVQVAETKPSPAWCATRNSPPTNFLPAPCPSATITGVCAASAW
jgi:hypothetical protein